ncbi:MAG: hypothetical protein ACW9W4_10370 [Candidatus Nitrosopumilus sp. bin_7KS]
MNSRFLLFTIASLIAIMIVPIFDTVHAQPLQEVNADVIEFDGTFATVEISWNDNGASYYEVGCVSCMPNLSDVTIENLLVLSNVTAFTSGDALLYVIAYDDTDEIISAKQVMVKLR